MSITLSGDTGLAGAATGALNGTLGATTPSTVVATTLEASGVATFSAGSASAPAITTTGDTNTGVFFPAADTVATTTGGTERMRIDSSGNLLVGTTSGSARANIKGSTTDGSTYSIRVANSADADLFQVRTDGLYQTGTLSLSPYNYTTGSAANMFVSAGGAVQRSTSSLKYKNSVETTVKGLADVLKLRAVTYKGNNDGDTVFGGLIAEEVHEAGLTEFVQYAEDGSPDALAYGHMVSLAFKAIQEQQALIENLTTRLSALENK